MFSGEIRKMLLEVITSWQVWSVTVVLVVYIFIVNYVARIQNRRSRSPLFPKSKAPAPEAPAHSGSDDLELDEEIKEE